MDKKPNNFIGGVATTIRVPGKFLNKVKALSEEIGDSQNGTMLHLMYLGMKIYESTTTISFSAPHNTQSDRPQ